MPTAVAGTVGDLYLTLAEEVMKSPSGKFPERHQEALRPGVGSGLETAWVEMRT